MAVPMKAFPDTEAVSLAAAGLFARRAARSIEERGCFSVALAGGSTPRRLYRLLATPPWREQIDWSRCHLFWGDERLVPPDHPDSNYRLVRETLLDGVPIPASQVHRVPVEAGADGEVAEAYERELRGYFGEDCALPRFDLVLLGLGSDGHTASIFPTPPLPLGEGRGEGHGVALPREGSGRWVVATPPGILPPPVHRVTLTLPAINAARSVLFLVTGADKSEALRRVLQGDRSLPATRVHPTRGRLHLLADLAAVEG
jgi:6-phosphogluconolactonase